MDLGPEEMQRFHVQEKLARKGIRVEANPICSFFRNLCVIKYAPFLYAKPLTYA